MTFTATYAGNDDYAGATGTKTITVVDSSAPSIAVAPDEVSVDADEHEGTLALTYENLTITAMADFDVQYYNAAGEEISVPDWIEVLVAEQDPAIGEGYVVSYFMLENEGSARSVYFKVFAMGNEDFVYSNLVTVTQAAYEPGTDKYELVTDVSTLAAGDEILLAFVDMEAEEPVAKAMGAEQASNNRPAVDVVYNDDETLTPDATAQVITLEEGENGWYFNVGNGYLYAASGRSNWLRTEIEPDEDDNALATIEIAENGDATIVFQGTNSRNNLRYNPNNGSPVFSCYANSSSVVTLPRIYRKVAQVEEEIIPVTLNTYGYATFASSSAIDFTNAETNGYTAWQITGVSGTEITFSQITGAVAAGTGVLLKGTASETINIPVAASGTDISSTNKLVGFTAATVINSGEYYGLSGDKFVKVNGGTVPAGKALLPASVVGEIKALTFSFDDDATAIKTIDNGQQTTEGVIYNVAGQRLNKMQKGINIVNGKKILR